MTPENQTEAEAAAEIRALHALWRAVITQQLMDAASNSAKMEARYNKSQARHWLSGRTDDFHTVCDFANLAPDYVRHRASRALERNCRWRQPAAANSEVANSEISYPAMEPV